MGKILLLLLMPLLSFQLQARELLFPSMVVNGLEKYAGKKLDVFYISGRPAGIGTVGQSVNVNKIWSQRKSLSISPEGMVEVPETKVVNKFGIAFNYVIFSVYDKEQSEFLIKNADGSCPGLPNKDFYRAKKEHCLMQNIKLYNNITRKDLTVKYLQNKLQNGIIELNLN